MNKLNKPNLGLFSERSPCNRLLWVFPGCIPLPLAISQHVYNLLEIWFLDQFLEFRTILSFIQIVGLVYLLPAEQDPFTSDINCLVFHTHHISVEFFYYIYETRCFVLTKEKSASLLNNFLEGGDPLTEAYLAYEIFVLQFVSPGNKSQL